MSLSDDLRAELARVEPEQDCDRLAELSGLFHSAGSVHLLGRGRVSVHLDLASSAIARRAFSLLRSFGVASEIRTYRQRAFAQATRYQLHLEGEPRALQVLHEAGVLSGTLAPLERPPRRVVARRCCRAAYLRGALLGSGSLSGPAAPHLEIRRPSREGAEFLAELAPLRVVERRGHAAAYAKGADAVEEVLAAAGSSDAVLRLEERAVMGAIRGRANRLANADHANLVRTSRAAHRQLEAIRRLEREGALGDLPERLREIAELRLRHPSLSLRELAARCRPPATKAAVHRRLARLERIADSLG
ncbi:MAG TPA: DNA-binding protein WhiA [Gaiellaceae bacterium]|nr:DNA-binding protein WhiA [Gaiellaceae bacterium]